MGRGRDSDPQEMDDGNEDAGADESTPKAAPELDVAAKEYSEYEPADQPPDQAGDEIDNDPEVAAAPHHPREPAGPEAHCQPGEEVS
jgi:hypothetical protein